MATGAYGEKDTPIENQSGAYGADDTPYEPAKPEGALKGLGKSLKAGIQELPGMVTGLADIPVALATGARPFTALADAAGEVTGFQPGKWAKETPRSAEYKAAQADVGETWKGVEKVSADKSASNLDYWKQLAADAPEIAKAYASNPMYTANQVVQSLPGMVTGGVASKALKGLGAVAGAGLSAEAAAAGAMGPVRQALPGYVERAVGNKWAAPVVAGIGEGAVTAGQAMANAQGEDQQKNAAAALGAGAGTGLIGGIGGRIANSLGLETAGTAMAKAGDGTLGGGLGATKRILGGAISEGVFQELPQSVQEAMWQNYADGKPIMQGVARQGIEGALAGMVMGAGANVINSTPATPPTQPPVTPTGSTPPGTPPVAPPGAPLQPGNTPDPMISFADGTVARKSEVDKYISGLPPEQQPAARAKLMGLAPQPAKASEAMGLTPTADPSLTNAAILAVDTGASQPTMSAFDQREADRPKSIEGDVAITESGAPITNRLMAQKAAERKSSETGQSWQPIQLGAKQFVIRPMASDTAQQSVEATPLQTQTVQPDQNTEQPQTDAVQGQGTEAKGLDQGSLADATPKQQAPKVTGKPQPTTLGTQTNAVAGPGFGVSDVVQKQPQAQAEQAPIATENVASTENEARNSASIATSTQDAEKKIRFAAFAEKHAGKPVDKILSLLVASEFGDTLATNELAQVSQAISENASAVADQARKNAAQKETTQEQKLKSQIVFAKMRVDMAEKAIGDSRDTDRFGLPADDGPNRQRAIKRHTDAQQTLVDLEGELSALSTPSAPTGAPMGVTSVAQPAQPVMGEGAGGSQPTQVALPKPKTDSKADLDHLFGVDQKRAKAIERIANGAAYFSKPLKAQEFIAKNGLKETHQSVKTARGWEIVAKSQPTETTSEPKAHQAEQDKQKTQANEATPKQQAAPAAGVEKAKPTVDEVARAIQLKAAQNRLKARQKSRKEREAKGYAPNSTPDSEQTDYDAEINAEPSEFGKRYAAALLGDSPLPMIEMFVHGNFEASEDVFKDITGVRIRGLSAADKKAALYKWANWTPEQIAKAESDSKERSDRAAEKNKQEDAKTRVMGEWIALDRLQIGQPGDKGVTGQEFVLQAVANGYNKAHSQKKGIATVYGLTNGKEFTTLQKGALTDFVKAAIAFGGLDKTLEYVNPPKPQAPEGFKDRSVDIGAKDNQDDMTAKAFVPPVSQVTEPTEITHNGTRLYKTKVKLGGEAVDKWAVESQENKRKAAAGERTIGGDSLHDTLDAAKKAADFEAKQEAQAQARKAESDAQEKEAQAKKDANKGKSIVERRKESVLDSATKLPPQAGLGAGTKRESMQKAVDQERAIVEKMVDDTAAKKRDNEAIDLVRAKGFILGLSNENLPVVKAGLEAQARLKANDYKKPSYRVHSGRDTKGSFYEITKTEYDYAQELLAQPPVSKTETTELDKKSTHFWKGETFRDIGSMVIASPDVYVRKEPKFTGSNLLESPKEFDYFLTDGRRNQKISKDVADYIASLKTAKAEQPAQPAGKYQGPSDVSTRAGQMELANRAGRIASLKAMNGQLRQIAPNEAWADANIESANDLDALQDQISTALVAAEKGAAATAKAPDALRTELKEMSGAELRAIFEAMNLAGKNLMHSERVDMLMAEDAAEVRAAIAKAQPAAQEPIKEGDTIKHTDGNTYTVVDVYGNTVDAERMVESSGGVTRKKGISINAIDAIKLRESAQEPAQQATSILDAANVTGKERIDALKDVKQGAITPEELQAAYPASAGKFEQHNAIAQEYGYTVADDGSIALASGKESGVKVILKGSRFQIRSKSTDDIVYSGATVDSMGKFLESFWGAEKTAKAQPAAQEPAKIEDGGMAMFSVRNSTPEKQLPLAQIERLVKSALRGIRNAPTVRVVANPEAIGLVAPVDTVPSGVTMTNGDIYVFQSGIGSVLDVYMVVFHELFHKGLQNVMPKADYVAAMQDIAKADGKVRQYASEWSATKAGKAALAELAEKYSGKELADQYEALATEEALARIAEDLKAKREMGAKDIRVRRLVAWLAKVADKLGMTRLADKLRSLSYNEAEKFVIATIGRAGGRGRGGGVRYSTGMTNNDVVGNQGGRSADDTTPGAGIKKPMTVNPTTLVFRESEQNRKDELTSDTDEFDPIVVIDEDGELSILDGHNRASVAIDRGDSLKAVKVTKDEYDRLQEKGFEDGEIAWAALQRADQSYAAGNLDSQFPGSEISKGGDKAWDDLIENESTAPDSGGARFRAADKPAANPNSWDAPEASKFDDLVYKLQDRHIDTKRVIESIKLNGALSDEKNVYLQEELFHGRAAARTEDFVNKELSPLVNMMRLSGIDIAALDEYLHARHAEEANELIAGRNPDILDGGSGMTTQDAKDYLAKLPQSEKAKLEAVAAKVDAILGETRQLYADYDLESQKTVDGWGAMFKHYVPLMREDKDGGMGIGQGISIKGREVKSRTGSTRKVVDILANIALQRERAIVRGEKNRVATALVGLVKANPNKDFWHTGYPPSEKVYDAKTNKVITRADPLYKSRENVVMAKIRKADGTVVEKAVIFNEDNARAVRMAAALKNLDAAQLEGLLGVSAKITRYFAAINTQYNPIFGTVNLVRDVQGALFNLATTPLKGQAKTIAGDTLSALKGIYVDARAARDGKTPTSKWAALWEEFQNEGGQTGFRDLFANSEDRSNAIKRELNPNAWMDSPLGKVFTADGTLKVPLAVAQKKATGVFDWLSDYNLAMENAVRLASYKAGIDQGMSKPQAASLAKNLTVNFNRKGQVGQQAGALYAFFNASMQGSARLGQTLFTMEPGKPKTIRLSATGKKIVYGGVLLGVAQAVLLSAAGFDDEEPPDFVRERSMIIPTSGKTYITIPMPLGLHVLPNMGRIPAEFAMRGFKDPAKHIAKMVGLFAGAFNPIGGGASLVQMLSPTAIDPLVALAENKDWTGKPIAKVSFDKAIPGHQLAKDTASTPAKFLSEAVNFISGGTEYTAGVLSPTPDQIDYLWGQATGGVGREVNKANQTVSSVISGEELPPHKMPLVGRFYGNADAQSSQSNQFYANINRLNKHEAEIKGRRKDGDSAGAAQYLSENPDARLFMAGNKAERDVQKLRSFKRDLIDRDADKAQVTAIEDRIKARVAQFNELVKAYAQREAA